MQALFYVKSSNGAGRVGTDQKMQTAIAETHGERKSFQPVPLDRLEDFHSRYLLLHTQDFPATPLPQFASNRRKKGTTQPDGIDSMMGELSLIADRRKYHRVLLHASGFIAIFLAAAWLRKIHASAGPHSARLSPANNRIVRVRFRRCRVRTISRDPRPHFFDSGFWFSTFRRHVNRFERPILSTDS